MMRDEPIERRLARIESRLVTLMLHLGIDPYEKMYETFNNSRILEQRDKFKRSLNPTEEP